MQDGVSSEGETVGICHDGLLRLSGHGRVSSVLLLQAERSASKDGKQYSRAVLMAAV